MVDLIQLEKSFIETHIKVGGTVVDFTMGNGHDTLYLSRAVGENGSVFAFDIQSQAIESTKRLLEENNAPRNYTLIHDSHANVKEYVKTPICAGMFNLGYLPGGDKSITTLRESTKQAVCSAIDLLDRDGGILIAVYPGHAEGTLEGQMLAQMFEQYDRKVYCISQFRIVNSPTSPFFFLIEKK